MLKDLINQWVELHKSKSKSFQKRAKPEILKLRAEILKEMGDSELLVFEDCILKKQHHANYSTVEVWSKDNWERHEQWLRDKNPLNWI